MEITRVPGSRNVRIEMPEEQAHKLVRGLGVLDDVQNERFDACSSRVQDSVSELVLKLADELRFFGPPR